LSKKKTQDPDLAKYTKSKYDNCPMQKVLAAIMERDGRLLLAKRKKGDRFEGLWEFPGGKLEPGETPEEGLKRELREEFGIETRVGHFLCSVRYTSPTQSIKLLAYEVTHITGQFSLYEHEEIRWVFLEELKQYPLAEPDAALIPKLRKRALATK
jgi:8-oxo-dGTP diphosphatase